jgi:hypothetical protein
MCLTALQIVVDVLVLSLEAVLCDRLEFCHIAGVLDALAVTSKNLNEAASLHRRFCVIIFFRRLMEKGIKKTKYWNGIPIRMRDDILEAATSTRSHHSLARATAGWTMEEVWNLRILRSNRAFDQKFNSLAALYWYVVREEAVCYTALISTLGARNPKRCVHCKVVFPNLGVPSSLAAKAKHVRQVPGWNALHLFMACMGWDGTSSANSLDSWTSFSLSYWNAVLQSFPGLSQRNKCCSEGCVIVFWKTVVADVNGNELSKIQLHPPEFNRKRKACGHAMMYQAKTHAFARNECVRKVISRAVRKLRTSEYAIKLMTYALNVDVCILHALATVSNGVSPRMVQALFSSGDPEWRNLLSNSGIRYAGRVLTSGGIMEPALICDSTCNEVLSGRVRKNSVLISKSVCLWRTE